MVQGHPAVRLGQYLFGRKKSPEIFGFIWSENVEKTRNFFGETSPRTFATRGLIDFYQEPVSLVFGWTNMPHFRRVISSSKIRQIGFCFLKFSAA